LWALRRRMLQKARLFPDHFDVSRLRGIRSLREFDDKVTGYYCGFTGADDYRFVPNTTEPRRKLSSSQNITFVETADGGHCAFVGVPVGSPAGVGNSSDGRYDDGYWAENEIVNFLRRF